MAAMSHDSSLFFKKILFSSVGIACVAPDLSLETDRAARYWVRRRFRLPTTLATFGKLRYFLCFLGETVILQSIILIKEASENIIPRYDRPSYHNNETLEICYHVDSVRALRVSTHNILVQNVVCYILLVLCLVFCPSVATILVRDFIIIFHNFIIIRGFPR